MPRILDTYHCRGFSSSITSFSPAGRLQRRATISFNYPAEVLRSRRRLPSCPHWRHVADALQVFGDHQHVQDISVAVIDAAPDAFEEIEFYFFKILVHYVIVGNDFFGVLQLRAWKASTLDLTM